MVSSIDAVMVVSYFNVFLILNVFCSGRLQVQGEKDPEDFRLTKFLDIRLDGKYGSMRPDLRDIIRSHVLSDMEGSVQDYQSSDEQGSRTRCSDICLKESFEKNINNSLNEIISNILTKYNFYPLLEKLKKDGGIGSRNTFAIEERLCGYKEVCKTLVGVDKIMTCQSTTEDDDLNEFNMNKKTIPRSCKEVHSNGNTNSGIYEIQPRMMNTSIMVLCDMDTEGGGWTHIHRRIDGLQDFYLGWREYKFGFGNLDREFWMGLENIRALTESEVNELLVEIIDRDGNRAYANYKVFGIGSEVEGYSLKNLSGFSGDAGDSLAFHLGSKFTTKDFDQDENDLNCAESYSGAWWYKSCHISNLNGKYLNVDLPVKYMYKGLHWKTFRSHEYCHAKARMLIRPIGNKQKKGL